MIKKTIFTVSILFTATTLFACTNFLVGKAATTDGSTFITYSADSYFLFGALYHYPAATYPAGTMLDIHDWDTGKYLGKIKQVEKTYSVIGNMNEYQVSIGETTFGGRPELVDTTAIMDYGSLMYIALQRSKSAREAIKVMTDLVAEYGYNSEGESFSIGDPNEVWIMEMIGKGPDNKGAVWVAERIPDDCVSAHANQARITTFPYDNKDNCLYSEDVIAFAREKGYFKGKNKDFSFSDTYAPLDYGALRYCEARVWSFFRKIDPTMDKYITYVKGETKERMPLWVRPTVKLNAQKLKDYMRDQYEGTEFDMTKGVGAGPFGSKLRCSPLTFKVDSIEYGHDRPIATQQTGFTFVAQMRNWLPNYIGGLLWFGVDDAATGLYVPMYCGINAVPECFRQDNGSLLEYSSTSAFWTFNWVANYAYSKYSYMYPDIKKVQEKWESDFNALVPAIDKLTVGMNETDARIFLTDFSLQQAEKSTAAWKKLGEYLLVKYMDGNIKKEKDGKFLQNEYKIPPGIIRAGYPEEFLRQMVKENPGLRVLTEEEMKNRK
ncbi:MAG: C69 family dipeptidase [Paludibacter sp.]|nr:C69 family dipeptidase [Paludibacter sp.]